MKKTLQEYSSLGIDIFETYSDGSERVIMKAESIQHAKDTVRKLNKKLAKFMDGKS